MPYDAIEDGSIFLSPHTTSEAWELFKMEITVSDNLLCNV